MARHSAVLALAEGLMKHKSHFSFYAPNDKDLVPAKLIWKLATETRELVLPFAVTDLPIP